MKNAFLALGAVVLALATGMWIGGHPENLPDGVRDFFVDDVAVISSASTTSDQAADEYRTNNDFADEFHGLPCTAGCSSV